MGDIADDLLEQILCDDYIEDDYELSSWWPRPRPRPTMVNDIIKQFEAVPRKTQNENFEAEYGSK